MDVFYFKILNTLEPLGVGIYSNISPLLLDRFPVSDNYHSIHIEHGNVIRFLELMIKDNLINLQNEQFSGLGSGNATTGLTWLDTYEIKASITSHGLTVIENEKSKQESQKLTRSLIITNEAVTKASASSIILNDEVIPKFNKTQKSISISNLAVALAIMIFTGYQAFKGEPTELKYIRQRLDTTSQILQKIQHQLEIDQHKPLLQERNSSNSSQKRVIIK